LEHEGPGHAGGQGRFDVLDDIAKLGGFRPAGVGGKPFEARGNCFSVHPVRSASSFVRSVFCGCIEVK
jgi:hypothetical protein